MAAIKDCTSSNVSDEFVIVLVMIREWLVHSTDLFLVRATPPAGVLLLVAKGRLRDIDTVLLGSCEPLVTQKNSKLVTHLPFGTT